MKTEGEKNGAKVILGHRINLLDYETSRTLEFVLVGENEASDGFVTVASPVGQSILGREVDEELDVETPSGLRRFRIVSIG